MLWVKKGTHVIDHPRFLEAGPIGRDLWDWGMLYAGAHETDGELPMVAIISSPWGAGGKANIKVAAKLVTIGLWERTDEGFRICRWAEQGNQTKAQIATDRSAARERKARGARERKAAPGSGMVRANSERTNTKVPTSTSYSSSESGSPDQIASAVPRVLGLDGEGGAAWQAWRDGISRTTGKPVSELRPSDKPDLVAFANAHAGGLRGEALMAWIAETAEAWARQYDPAFGGFKPAHCKTWLDAGRPPRPARTGPPRQQLGSQSSAPWMTPQNFDFAAGDK